MTPKGWHSRGYLPHFDLPESLQFLTFRRFDSLPAEAVEKLRLMAAPAPTPSTATHSSTQEWETAGCGNRKSPRSSKTHCFISKERAIG